ncbi:MAG: DHA2 family efflux MFS transporter permease subunit [Myxococcota bacterium]
MSSIPEASADGGEEFRLDFRTLMIVFAVMLAVILEIIDSSIVNVALPDMMGNLGATIDEIGWVVTGYIVSNVIVIPMTSWLSSRFGRKRYLTGSILLFTAASVACGNSTSLGELVIFRVIQGCGGGALLATAQSVMIETFPPSRQGVGQAIFGVGAMIGPSLGPTLGGWITDTFSWPWVFYINLPLGLLAAFLCVVFIENPRHLSGRKKMRVDYAGIALLIVSVGALQILLERGHRLDWFDSSFIRVLAVTAGLGGVAFVVRELTAPEPVVDLRVLRHPSLTVGCLLGFVMGVGLYGSIFLFPLYSQSLLGWTAWQSGMAILPSSIATAVSMLIVGRLVWPLGPRPLFTFGLGVFGVALYGMAHWNHLSGWDDIFWPQVMRGIAMGAMFVPLSTATLRTLPTTDVTKGAGLYNLFRQLGGSMGIAVLGTLLDQRATVHKVYLSEHVGLLDPMAGQRLGAVRGLFELRGLDPTSALHAAHRALDGMLGLQAQVLAFEDAYVFIGAVCLVASPLLFFLGRGAREALQAREAERRGESAAPVTLDEEIEEWSQSA